jgi:hypothetical protein
MARLRGTSKTARPMLHWMAMDAGRVRLEIRSIIAGWRDVAKRLRRTGRNGDPGYQRHIRVLRRDSHGRGPIV